MKRVPALSLSLLILLAAPAAGQRVNEAPGGGFETPGATRTGYLVADIKSGDPARVASALRTLPELKDSHAQPVIEAALSGKLGHEDKLLALDDAARRGKQIGQDLFILALKKGDDALKTAVLERVSAFERDFALPVLEQAMSDEQVQIRLEALKALATMDEQTRHQILTLAAKDTQAGVRLQAATDAANLPKNRAWSILKGLLNDPSNEVATRARASAAAVGVDPAEVSPLKPYELR